MKIVASSTILGLSLLLFATATFLVFPYYQYYVDPDAVSYLTLAKRYAHGDFQTAVNGYWSPWSCWLTAVLIKQGMAAMKAAIFINALGAGGFLGACFFLFKKFTLDIKIVFFLQVTIAVFLVYAVFKQSFADLWGFFFLLVALLILLKNDFLEKPYWWLVLGCVGALAYLAKAYALPYFVLWMAVSIPWMLYRKESKISVKKTLLILSGIFIPLLLLSFPWWYLLHDKYGSWMTGTAGSLNLSWYLVGHPFYKEGISLLLPPPYANAIYYWEDPFLVNGATPHFWNTLPYFVLQLVRLGYNALKFFNSANELSCFFIPASLLFCLLLFSKKLNAFFPKSLSTVAIAFLLFPLGYAFINFEARYLWCLLPMSMLVAVLGLEKLRTIVSRRFYFILVAVFCMSYLVYPVWDMKAMFQVGKAEFQLAQQLKAHGIQGGFACNIAYGKEFQRVARVAYFSENPYYSMP
jgi:hypothetical protein